MATITEPHSLTELHRHMVRAAVCAPSPENTQPWYFRLEDQRLVIYHDRRRSFDSDVNSMLDYTALGAAIENAVIAARELGFEAAVEDRLPANPSEATEALVPVAALNLVGQCASDPLFAHVESRCTCRRMDGSRSIPRDVLKHLASAVEQFPAVRIDWLTKPEQVRQIAKLVGLGNRIRFEHPPFHAEFYGNVRWSQEAAVRTCDGLDIATLQLPIGVASILGFLRRWSRMRVANWLGFSRSVARQAAREVRGSGAVGILSLDQALPGRFLEGGRALERLWLSATAAGVGLHPTASLPVFLAHSQLANLQQMLPNHWQMVQAIDECFGEQFPDLRGRAIQMVFRLGFADPPAQVRSLRRPVENVLDLN